MLQLSLRCTECLDIYRDATQISRSDKDAAEKHSPAAAIYMKT